MSDETPRELTEPEIDAKLEALAAGGSVDDVISEYKLEVLLHMARRGARAAMAARLTDAVLREAVYKLMAWKHGVYEVQWSDLDAMRHVLLDAIGANPSANPSAFFCADCGHPPHPSGRCDGLSADDDESVLCECRTGAGDETP